MGPKKKSSKRGGKKPVFKPKGQGSSGRISSLLDDAKEQMNAGKYGRASAVLKKVLAIEEDHPEALRIFATLHLKLGSLMAAKTSFETLARKAIKDKDYRLAESLLREYLTVAPRYVPFLELLGKALEANGHFMAAVAEYGKAIDIFVEEGDAELQTKGAELYEAMKVIGAESALTKKLATYFEETPTVKADVPILNDVLSEPIQAERDETGPTESPSSLFQRPSDEGAPAPFPWTPTDEPDDSSLALKEEVQSEVEPVGMSEDATEAFLIETQSMPPEHTVDPLPWEEAAAEESIREEASSFSSALTDESPHEGPNDESVSAKEEQLDSSPNAHTDESLIPQMSTPVSWDMSMPSSDATVAPLPWEENFEKPSSDSASTVTSDSISEETVDSLQSSETLTDSDAVDSGLSFNAVKKDSSSFAPFPWEDQADSPDISIPDPEVASEEEARELQAASEEEVPSLEDSPAAPVEDVQAPESLAVEEADSSDAGVEVEGSPSEHDPVSGAAIVERTDVQSLSALEEPEPVGMLPSDSDVTVPLAEEDTIVEENRESAGEFVADLSESLAIQESRDGLDSVLDGPDDTIGDLPQSETEDVGEKPLEQAAVEAVAALQGDAEPSFSLLDQPGTLELKELPEEDMTPIAEEETLAQAATEALTTFEDRLDTPVLSPDESQVRSEISEEIETTIDVPEETPPSDEIPAEPLADMVTSHEELSLSSTIESIVDAEPPVEEEQAAAPFPLEESLEVDPSEGDPAPLEEETDVRTEPETWGTNIQAEDERVESLITFDEDSNRTQSEEVLTSEEQEEEAVVAESSVEAAPIPLSPWDPQEEVVHTPSFSDDQVEEPVQESSGFPSTIHFAESEESNEVEEVNASFASSHVETPDSDLQVRAGLDIVYPEAEPVSFQEDEDVEEDLSPKGRPPTARSSGPTWAVAQSQEGSSASVEHKPLFPTANKVRVKVKSFTATVMSTTRAVSILLLLGSIGIGLVGLLTLGIVSISWVAVEERPNDPFHNMMKGPNLPRMSSDRNGYHVISQLGVSSSLYPIGSQQQDEKGKKETAAPAGSLGASQAFMTLAGWYQLSDPIAEFQAQGSQTKAWSSQYGSDLSKYHQWSGKSFVDIGYRSLEGPSEQRIISVHQLFIAEGFSGKLKRGVNRLATDLEAWRYALGQAKTLRIKMLALEVIKDDLAILSALLGNPRVDRSLLPILTQLGRPISQNERSLRWPMQNQFVLEVDQVKTYMDSQRFPERPLYQKVMTYLPLPEQKILNAHAIFYERLMKHDASLHLEGDPRTGIPKRYPLSQTPANALSDYFVNPIDNVVVTQSKVDWRDITGRLIELEARLRLTTLQARIRRPPETRDPISRIARAGQDFFDPFTGYTMLLNASKTRLYSVGSDGVDDDGDLVNDVAVPLFRK